MRDRGVRFRTNQGWRGMAAGRLPDESVNPLARKIQLMGVNVWQPAETASRLLGPSAEPRIAAQR